MHTQQRLQAFMQPQHIQMKDYTYDLPESKIAKYPLAERDSSKLLVYRDGGIVDDLYSNLHKHLPENALLIFNNTKVIQARLIFTTSTGAKIELFCLEPAEEHAELSTAMAQKGSVKWRCLVGRLVKWNEPSISLQTKDFTLHAEIAERQGNTFIIQFNWEPSNIAFASILEQFGEMPIPPYLKRKEETIDETRYQTVYAEQKGSVAAPTAGLHFTPHIFAHLKSIHTQIEYLTLHVGAGTFKPVSSETIEGHEMHAEWIEVNIALIEKIMAQISNNTDNNPVVAVGTTSLRTIETLYWMGVKANMNINISLNEILITQWDAYNLPQHVHAIEALQSLLNWLQNNQITKLICKTQILIVPSYTLRIVNALITNFHQPSSTLLLLIAAVIGDDWKKVYAYALDHDYRFLSYGDGSLLFGRNP